MFHLCVHGIYSFTYHFHLYYYEMFCFIFAHFLSVLHGHPKLVSHSSRGIAASQSLTGRSEGGGVKQHNPGIIILFLCQKQLLMVTPRRTSIILVNNVLLSIIWLVIIAHSKFKSNCINCINEKACKSLLELLLHITVTLRPSMTHNRLKVSRSL